MRLSLFASLVGTLLLAGSASAAPIGVPEISFNGWEPGLAALGCTTEGLVTNCSGAGAAPGSGAFTVTSWNLHLDSDPTVVNFIALQNNLLVAQTFIITVQIPLSGTFGPGLTIQGSVVGGATDTTGNGVTLTTNGTNPIYSALVDGSPVQTLLNSPQSFSAGAFGSAGFGPAAFGPTAIGGSATSTIGITMRFTLSPGDLASYTSVFTMVPESSTLLMLAGGLAGLIGFGRHRRA